MHSVMVQTPLLLEETTRLPSGRAGSEMVRCLSYVVYAHLDARIPSIYSGLSESLICSFVSANVVLVLTREWQIRSNEVLSLGATA